MGYYKDPIVLAYPPIAKVYIGNVTPNFDEGNPSDSFTRPCNLKAWMTEVLTAISIRNIRPST